MQGGFSSKPGLIPPDAFSVEIVLAVVERRGHAPQIIREKRDLLGAEHGFDGLVDPPERRIDSFSAARPSSLRRSSRRAHRLVARAIEQTHTEQPARHGRDRGLVEAELRGDLALADRAAGDQRQYGCLRRRDFGGCKHGAIGGFLQPVRRQLQPMIEP